MNYYLLNLPHLPPLTITCWKETASYACSLWGRDGPGQYTVARSGGWVWYGVWSCGDEAGMAYWGAHHQHQSHKSNTHSNLHVALQHSNRAADVDVKFGLVPLAPQQGLVEFCIHQWRRIPCSWPGVHSMVAALIAALLGLFQEGHWEENHCLGETHRLRGFHQCTRGGNGHVPACGFGLVCDQRIHVKCSSHNLCHSHWTPMHSFLQCCGLGSCT